MLHFPIQNMNILSLSVPLWTHCTAANNSANNRTNIVIIVMIEHAAKSMVKS